MKENCNKYEALFTFLSNEEFAAHINECENCKKEHEKMVKVSELIADAKPYYKAQKSKMQKLKTACVAGFLLMSGLSFGVLNHNYDIIGTLTYHNVSIEDMGFPIDDYGLLMVD